MAARKASIVTKTKGLVGQVRSFRPAGFKDPAPICGATVTVVDNRYSGVVAEVLHHHNGFKPGDLVQLGHGDILVQRKKGEPALV